MANFFIPELFFYDFPRVLAKFPITLKIVLAAVVIGLGLGSVLALFRIRKTPVLSQLAAVYISYIHGVPIVVQLFMIYYGLPMLLRAVWKIDTRSMDKMIFIYVTYGLNQAGFMAEIIRGAVQSVPKGQWEAGYSVGLSAPRTFFGIILPQSVRVALPSFETDFIGLFRNTALAYMVGIVDMMGQVSVLSSTTFHTLEGYLCVVVIQVVISIILEQLFGILNKRLTFGKKI